MKSKSTWLTVSYVVILSLVLLSCAPAASPTPGPTTTAPTSGPIATTTSTATATATTTPSEEKPRYGGVFVFPTQEDTRGFDQIYKTTTWSRDFGQHLVNDRLLIGDWTMGAAGSGKTDFALSGWAPEGIYRETGSLAESFEIPDDQTIIFKIRQGVHFHNKSPVNGRELNAEDVVFSIKYMYLNPNYPALTYNMITAPGGLKLTDVYLDPKDKWTVIVKVENYAWAFLEDLGVKGVHIIAHEVVEKYGNLLDWHNAVGTGGFELTDYVPGSSLTFVRNPNYWMKNPIGPGKGDQLPYADGLKVLVIREKSTAFAAFRTGKIDLLQAESRGYRVDFEDKKLILKTNPETPVKENTADGMPVHGIRLTSTSPLAKPLLNQRVRWALSMAIDRDAMIRDLFNGAATKYVFYWPPSSPYYRSPDQMPEVLEKVFGIKPEEAIMVKKMFEYNPDEAKKILAQEGYPSGFKTKVITNPAQVDYHSIIKQYWQKIGVELEIDAREASVYQNAIDAHSTEAMFYYDAGYGTNPAKWVFYGPGDPKLPFTVSNRWELSDPILDDYIRRTNAIYGKDLDQQNRLLQEAEAWIVWKAPWIGTPAPHDYRLWQPWLKNYYGFDTPGFRSHFNSFYFAWVDQDLKKKMGR